MSNNSGNASTPNVTLVSPASQLNNVEYNIERLHERLDHIEKDIRETREVFLKIWSFVESMKDNPMLAAMTGGLGKK